VGKEMNTQHLSIDQMQDFMRAPWIAGDFGAIAREISAPGFDLRCKYGFSY
jgi:hypothetical protein